MKYLASCTPFEPYGSQFSRLKMHYIGSFPLSLTFSEFFNLRTVSEITLTLSSCTHFGVTS